VASGPAAVMIPGSWPPVLGTLKALSKYGVTDKPVTVTFDPVDLARFA
jgi:hypothetical protein